MFCRTCGKQIIDEAVICPYCGCLTGVPQQPPTPQYQNYDQFGNPINQGYDVYGNPNNPYIDRYGNHNTTPIIQQNMSSEPDEVNVGLVVLAVFFPLVGLILGSVNRSNGKVKSGKAYITAAAISWGVSIFLSVILGIIAAIIS